MLVLVIFVISLLALGMLLAVRFLPRLQPYRQAAASRRLAPEPLFAGVHYDQAFDSDYGLLWQMQAPALEFIRESGGSGLPVPMLRPWFERVARRYPDLFEGHTFEEWVEFLQKSCVAECSGDRVFLTPIGYELLDHCRMAG